MASGRVELMYRALRLESMIELYVDKLKSIYFVAERKTRVPRPSRAWLQTKSMIEDAIATLDRVKRLVSKFKIIGLPQYLESAIKELDEAFYRIDSKCSGMPNIKRSVSASITSIALEARDLYRRCLNH